MSQSASASQPKAAAYMAASGPGNTASDTNLSRGIGGMTGASGRDFAAQAQGLGGLVHVYATFAANLFAVSAAFGALSKAMDTTNLIKGLDQLGASSGRALGSLAKQMVAVTDGAISMQQAMSSTAMASAGGMSSANILRMTQVAKNASLALGRDMPDSMDRLTKGIIKIQPELLDELGIMARVIPAQEAYARSVGKTTTTLSDYEKRQAFANAVLEEGERKFNSIKLDANPYSKILASMTNLLQTGLELINKVFTPILNILSSSPTALTAAMVGIGAVLLKQAMPALGYFKENLKASADAAQKIANERSVASKAAQTAELETTRAHVENLADVKIAAADRAEKQLKAVAAATGFKPSKGAQEIIKKGPLDVDPKDYEHLEGVAKKLENRNPLLAKSYRDLSVAIRESADAERTYGKVVSENTAKIQQRASAFTTAGQTQVLADRANLAAASRSISSTAAATASVHGLSAAWREAREAVKSAQAAPKTDAEGITTPKMGTLRGGWTLLTAGISGATAALGTFLEFAGVWIAGIGILIAGFSALDSYLSKNTKELEDFTKSLDTGTDAIKLATDVMDKFNKLPPGTAMTSQDIIARANAMGTLTDSIETQLKLYEKALDAAGNWDRVKDKFWSTFGLGSGDKLADNIKAEVVKAISLLDSEDTKKAAIEKLAKVLNVKPDLKSVEEGISKLGKQGIDGAYGLSKLKDELSEVGKKSKETVNVLETLKSTTEALTRANTDYNNSIGSKTEEQKFGEAIINNAIALGKALQDPIYNMVALNDLFKDSKNLAGFNPQQVESIIKYKDELSNLVAQQTDYDKTLSQLNEKLTKLKSMERPDDVTAPPPITGQIGRGRTAASLTSISGATRPESNTLFDSTFKDRIKESQNLINRTETARAKNMSEQASLLAKLNENNNLTVEAFRKGANLMDMAINNAIAKANTNIGLAKLQGLEGPEVEKLRTELRQSELDARMGLIDAVLGNTLATISNTIAYEKQKAEKNLESVAQKEGFPATLSPTARLSPEDQKKYRETLQAGSTVRQLENAGETVAKVQGKTLSYKELGKAIDDAVSNKDYETATQLQAVKSQMTAATAQKIAIKGEKAVVAIEGTKAVDAAIVQQQARMNALKQEGVAIDKEKISLANQYSGVYSKTIIELTQAKDLEALSLKQAAARAPIEAMLANFAAQKLPSLHKDVLAKTEELNLLKQTQKTEAEVLKARQAGAAAMADAENISLKFKQKNELGKLDQDLLSAQISAQKEKLSLEDASGAFSKEEISSKSSLLAIQQQDITNSQALVSIEEARGDALVKIAGQKAADEKLFGSVSAVTLAEEKRINDLYDKRKSTQTQIGKITVDNLTKAGISANALAAAEDLSTKFKQKNELKKLDEDLMSAQLSGEKERLSVADSLGKVDKEFLARRNMELGLDQQQITNNQALVSIDEARMDAIGKLAGQKALIAEQEKRDESIIGEATQATLDLKAKITAEETRLNELYDKRVGTQILTGKLALDNVTTAGLAAEKQAQMNKLLETQNDLVSTLTKLFGDVGTALGDTVNGLLNAQKAQVDLTAKKKEEMDALASATKPGEEIDRKKEYDINKKYTDLSTKQELNSISNIAASSKKMFDQKSAAYKILDTVERAANIGKLAMQAKELAMEFGLIGAKEASTAATVTGAAVEKTSIIGTLIAKGQSAILSALAAPWPLDFVAGTAMAAIVAGLIGSVGGGGENVSVDMTGKTSADKQAVAGTGQAYVDGKLTDTGGGVFGDTEAKSKSIVNSLEILSSNSIEGLDYDNKLLQAFKGLSDSLTKTSQAIYNIPGLRKGGAFGTQAGTTTVADGGLFNTGFLSSVFGGTKTQTNTITSAGIQLRGSLQQLIDDTTGSVIAYKDVLTHIHTSGGWFSSDRDTEELNRQVDTAGQEVRKGISEVFQNAKDVFGEVGSKAGIDAKAINTAFASINFAGLEGDIDTMGLTGQAALDQLNAVIGTKLDETAKRLFSGFDKFKKFGEGYLETVVRVTDGNNKVDQALRSMGNTFDVTKDQTTSVTKSWGTFWGTITGTYTETFGQTAFDISEAIIKKAGGLQKFMDQASFFKDNFLTEAQRLAPVQESVSKQLTKLHVSTDISRKDFAKLVNAQDLSTVAGRDLYQSLQDLAPGLDEVLKASEAAAEAAKKLADSALDLEIKIYQLKGSNEALNLTRQKELDAMDESLRPRQRYINALTDEIALRDKLKSAYDTTNNSLTASIKSLQDYKTALTSGASSTLSPAEKYAQSKAIFEQTAAAAKVKITTSSSAAEIKTRDDAVANLSKASDSFLANSKVMNASGTQYAADFAAVGTAVDATSTALENQQTETQKQLGFLDKIALATQTTAQLLDDYLKAVGVTTIAQASATASGSTAAGVPYPKLASGGLASGMTLVGEQGPELVDFSAPARVYSNADSKNLVNNDALIAEIKALRQEVAQLREDQKEQTGHLITTTFMASTRNAETVNNGYAEALNQQNWKSRSAVTID
jgi:hypothetical protein